MRSKHIISVSLYYLPHLRLFLIDCGLTKVQLLSVLIFLNEKNEMRSLKRSQN